MLELLRIQAIAPGTRLALTSFMVALLCAVSPALLAGGLFIATLRLRGTKLR
jgi:hypothetical protein